MRIFYDDASPARQLETLRLSAELARLLKERKELAGNAAPVALVRTLKIGVRIREIAMALGKRPGVNPNPEPQLPDVGDDDAPLVPRKPTAGFYKYDPTRTHGQRKKLNSAAMTLLNQINAGEIDGAMLSDEQKATLAEYSGTGGALIGADGKKGSAYEYYTPKPIAEGIWSLLAEEGFAGGKVLDPCAGVGIFGATAPTHAAIDAVELNATSGQINALVNAGPGYTATVSPYEKIAAATPDEIYDAVVTNVPFGGVADRGGNQLHDNRYQKEPLQNYFILRSLEKLKPGGLAVFITPPRCVSGKGGKEEELRVSASYMAEFRGAYRLPNSVFGTAEADTMTDVIVFRKYSREALDKINELREQSPQTLVDAGVQWPEFINGDYFKGDGHRFILGEFVPKNPEDFRPVDRVISPATIPEIGAMLKKLPASRINWELLDATETTPILYAEGDTITQAGQTLQLQGGSWVPLKRNEESTEAAELIGQLADPYAAFENRVSYPDAVRMFDYMNETSQSLDIPAWLRGALAQLKKLKEESQRSAYWNAGIVGLSVMQVLKERLADGTGTNFVTEYAALSDAMQKYGTAAKNRPSQLGGDLKTGLATLCNHYQKKTGFSALWRGDVQDVDKITAITADGTFEGLRYDRKSHWVPLADAKGIFGEQFNPLEDAEWCVSGDGSQVTRADDYYVGNYAEFIRRIDTELANCTDEAIRAKLLRQKTDALNFVDRVDTSKMTFNLFSPHVTLEEKAAFLRRFVHPSAAVVFDEKTGEQRVDIDVPGSNLTDREKLYNRVGDYLKNGTITLGGAKLSMSDAEALRELRRIVTTANEQFNSWVKGNATIVGRLEAVANDPEKLRFRAVDDESALTIPGMNPELKLHGYQNSFVRKQGREFSGINGFGVGLGKTFTALAVAQYVQSIGVKKKTFFVVPNSVLSNWRKEAGRAYASTDDCLFIGLRVLKGKPVVNSSNFDADLTSVMENRHSKIFMTMEAFERIRLREDTIKDFEGYMRSVDAAFAETEDKKQDEKNKGRAASTLQILSNKTGAAPYLEDMGVDSIIIDEAHMMKNGAETSEFKSAKYLSLAPASNRALDAQAKAWYIRKLSPLDDGVLGLTATPITNSPLEIYSMLSLAVGHQRVNDMCLGTKGADDFMHMMCAKENIDDVTMDGIARTTDVFVGLENVSVLRRAITDVATIKSAEDVGDQIVVPDADEHPTPITLPDDVVAKLVLYKGAFRYAMDEISQRPENRGDPEAFEKVAAMTGEPMDLIGHPFNLINKMTLIIADPELDRRASFYLFPVDQAELAATVVEQFNAKKIIEKRPRPSPMTQGDAIISSTVKKDEATGKGVEEFKIAVRAAIVTEGAGQKIAIDTIDPAAQSAFELLAEKAGLGLDVTVPPKLAALLENFSRERATPRGVDDEGNPSHIVKQIIFCDILALHNKLKMILTKRAGISPSKIAIITGKTNNTPDEILAVQNGFNANGEDNAYEVVIANEKAEVGINLQKGTQAIHHLTIGWTPDSLEQRNGRGVRQGNKTAKVNIYHYDADGTFDSSKRTMVDKKADWIGAVMDSDGGDSVAVSGGMTKEQMEALIDVVGDADAMTRMRETLAAKEAEARAATNRDKQLINLSTITKQRIFLRDNPDAKPFALAKIIALWKISGQISVLRVRVADPKASASAVAKNQSALAQMEITANGLRRQLAESVRIMNGSESFTVDDALVEIARRAKKVTETMVAECFTGKKYPSFKITMIEGSPIHADWQAEVDMAKSMIEESKANFVRQSAADGSYPKSVVEALAAGRGYVVKGVPIITGAFIRLDGGNLVAIDTSQQAAYGIRAGEEFGTKLGQSMLDKIVYPGTPGYDACLNDAAALEDALNEAGTVSNVYNKLVPEVAQRRKSEILAEYGCYNYLLPQPYFPDVIMEAEAAKSPLKAHILASQKSVIKALNGSKFVVSSGVAVVSRNNVVFNEREALRDYAIAHGLTVTVVDLDGEYWAKELVQKSIDASAFAAALTGDTVEAVTESARAFVRGAVAWFDFGAIDPITVLPYAAGRTLADAQYRARANRPDIISPVVNATPAAPADDVPTEPDAIVGISGNTRAWKEAIKSAAVSAGKGKYKWDGDAVRWNVLRSAWDYLVQNRPDAARELQLVKASRSWI